MDKRPTIAERKRLKLFISEIFAAESKKLDRLDYIFCSDNFLLEINKKFLNHDFYTDIITFELSGKNEPIIGEVYISIDRVKENSALYKTSLQGELIRVLFHGALHLCGYKDKSKKDTNTMRFKENHYITLFYSSPYVSRETSK